MFEQVFGPLNLPVGQKAIVMQKSFLAPIPKSWAQLSYAHPKKLGAVFLSPSQKAFWDGRRKAAPIPLSDPLSDPLSNPLSDPLSDPLSHQLSAAEAAAAAAAASALAAAIAISIFSGLKWISSRGR
jgi:hypothetical protein